MILTELEANVEDIINSMAMQIVEDEENQMPEEIKTKVIKELEKKSKKRGERITNGKEKTKEPVRKRRAG